MARSLIDYFNGFDRARRKSKVSSGAQALYCAILSEFNRAYYPATLVLSVRELKLLAGVKSTEYFYECRDVLKNLGLIDFKVEKKQSTYALTDTHCKGNTIGAKAEHKKERAAEQKAEHASLGLSPTVSPKTETETVKTALKERGTGNGNDWISRMLGE